MKSKIRLNWFVQGDAAQQLYITYSYGIYFEEAMKHLTLFLQSNFESAIIIYCWVDPFLTKTMETASPFCLFCHDLQSSYTFSATTLLTGMLGSGMVGCDARLQVWMLKVSMGGIAVVIYTELPSILNRSQPGPSKGCQMDGKGCH